jgi:hypothetical protein
MIWPNEPLGNGTLSDWCRRLLRACRSSEIQNGVGYRVSKTTSGAVLQFDWMAGGGATVQAGLTCMKITAGHGGDYLTCRTWDGANYGASDILVAKDWNMRLVKYGGNSESVDGITVSYTYPSGNDSAGFPNSDNNRTAAISGSGSETEVVYPRYKQQPTNSGNWECIWALPVDHTGVTVSSVELTWLEVAPSRVWARRYTQ